MTGEQGSAIDELEKADRARRSRKTGHPEGTETWLAERLVAQHGEMIRWCGVWKKWLIYRKGRWLVDCKAVPQRLAKECIRKVGLEGLAEQDQVRRELLLKCAAKAESAKMRAAVLTLASHEEPVQLMPESLDADPWLLNAKNGTVDLRTGKLTPHDPKKLLSKRTVAEYDPDAVCPVWDAFLLKIFGGDLELVTFVQRAVGYSLTGDISEHALFLLHGKGRNGKSTLTEAIQWLLGEYAVAGAPNLLVAQRSEKHPTELVDLFGRRMVVCQETGEEHRFDEAKVKGLTGGDRVSARRMREDYWSFEPTHKLWLCTNHKPAIRGQDEAIWSRIKLIPFEVTIPAEERDKGLKRKLRAEASGILAWAVRGALSWQREGLQTPAKVQAATEAYREAEDRLGAFLEDRCQVDKRMQVQAKSLYEEFRSWAQENGEYELSQKALGQRLAERGFEPAKSGSSRFWRGLGLKMTPQD